jgi:type IV secretion system protein VirB3
MDGGLKTDSLFIGLTRPPMLFGVSYMFVIANFMACMMLYVGTTEFKYMASMLPIHGIGYYICSKEPLFLELIKVRGEKCSRCKNKLYHGANSYDQF